MTAALNSPSNCCHCESQPISNHHALLCDRCRSFSGIRRLYLRRRGWSRRWDNHLLNLTRRAQQQLPLFPL